MPFSPTSTAPAALGKKVTAPVGAPQVDQDGQVRFTARLDPDTYKYLKLISETEDLSMNDALNITIRRQKHYPKDMQEIHAQVEYMLGELEVVQGQLDLCALHEEHLIEMIEGGKVEERLHDMRDAEEAATLAKAKDTKENKP
jgi:hypothetical protein